MSRRRKERKLDSKPRAVIGGLLCVIAFGGAGAVAATMLWQVVVDSFRALGWQEVPATIVDASLKTRSSKGGRTYEVGAEYRYEFAGRQYIGNRVGANRLGGSDNVGSWQKDTAALVAQAKDLGRPVIVHVNPEDPSEAILDPTLRWGLASMIGVFAIGGLGAGGLGLYLIFSTLMKPGGMT